MTPKALEPVERVARAICLARGEDPDELILPETPRFVAYFPEAQAALEAIGGDATPPEASNDLSPDTGRYRSGEKSGPVVVQPLPNFSTSPLRVNGVGRDADQSEMGQRVLHVYFNRPYSDDEMRAFHDSIRGASHD